MSLARIDDFKERLLEIPADDRNRVWSLALNELKHLKTTSWFPPGAKEPAQGYALTTLRSVLSDYRNAIREDERLGPEHAVLAFLRPSTRDQQTVREESLDSVLERGAKENRRPIDAEDLVDTAVRLLDAPSNGDRLPLKAAALALLTGRRTVELFRGRLEVSDDREERDPMLAGADGATLRFTGQAKPRGDGPTPAYDIPVLADPARVLRAFQELQREYPAIASLEERFPDESAAQINKRLDSKVASQMGEYVRASFDDNRGGTLTPKDLRGVYAATAWAWYAREESPQPTYNAFVAKILGHNEKDVGTALSYQTFYTVGESRTFDRAYRRANNQSAKLLDADARAQPDERLRGFIEGAAQRFREAAGVGATTIAPEQQQQSKLLAPKTEQGTLLVGSEAVEKVTLPKKGVYMAIDEAALLEPSEVPAAPAIAGPEAPPPAVANTPQAAAAPEQAQAPAPVSRREAAAARNKVELVGTVERVSPGNRPGMPTRLDVAVTNGNFRDTIPVSAFREAGEAAKQLEPGSRVEVEGYLAIRSVERDGQKRSVAGVTANAIEPAGEDVADRNYARLVGNVAQEPRFRENDRGAFAAMSIATGPEKFADVISYGAAATEIRDTLGQGDGIAVEGRVRPQEGRDGFPASVQVVANEVELERKKAPRVELEGALTRDPEISEGPKMTRVALQLGVNTVVDGQEQTEKRNVVSFTDKGATWPGELRAGDPVRVTGREDSSQYTSREGEERTFEFVRADRVEPLERERAQEPVQVKPAIAPDEIVDSAVGAALDGIAPEAQAAVQPPPLSIAALTREIGKTDWAFSLRDDEGLQAKGQASVEKTLEDVESSARSNPDATRELIDRIASQIGEQQPEVVDALRGAFDRGTGLETEVTDALTPAAVDLSSLPVFEPGGNDLVDRREDFTLALDQQMTVLGRSEDGARVFGRDGGGVLSVSKDAFTTTPSVNDEVMISRVDGKDQAQSNNQEVALER